MSRRKRGSIKTRTIVGLVSMVIVVILSIGWFTLNELSGPMPVVVENVVSISIPIPPKDVPPVQEVDVNDVSQVEDASSELRGEWLGLCVRNSITTVEDFRRQVEGDSVLSSHFSNFRWSKAEIKWLPSDIQARVSHRRGDVIKLSTKKIKLPKGDRYITDGNRSVRTNCCNDIKDDYQPYTPAPKEPKNSNYYMIYQPDPVVLNGSAANNPPSLPNTFYYYGGGGGGYDPPLPPKDPPPHDPPVPEPETIILFSMGLVILLAKRKFLTKGSK